MAKAKSIGTIDFQIGQLSATELIEFENQDFTVCKNHFLNGCTVKPGVSGHSKIDKTKVLKIDVSFHSKIDKTKVLKIDVSLMQVESIAECSLWGILQYF